MAKEPLLARRGIRALRDGEWAKGLSIIRRFEVWADLSMAAAREPWYGRYKDGEG
jgi:hypothetical protein